MVSLPPLPVLSLLNPLQTPGGNYMLTLSLSLSLSPRCPAPSYFSQYFLCQIKTAEDNGEDPCSNVKTLYIDRDPATFRDIALHLQGYYVTPSDGTHFVRLFADAQFYTRPFFHSVPLISPPRWYCPTG